MPIRNNQGMTLIEILISLAIAGIAVFSIGAFLTETNKMSVHLQSKDNFNLLISELSRATVNSKICTDYALQFAPSISFNPVAAATSAGQPVQVTLGTSGVVVGNNQPVPQYQLTSSDLRLTNVKPLGIFNGAGFGMYQGLLRLSGTRQDPLAGGLSRQITISSIIISINNNQISDCSANATPTFQSCTVDPNTLQCIGGGINNQQCPAGQIATGYQNGAIQCASVGVNCPPNQITIGISNGRVVCGNPPTSTTLPLSQPGSGGQYAQFMEISRDPASVCPPQTGLKGTSYMCGMGPFWNPQQIATILGMPECEVPVIGQKCFKRGQQCINTMDISGYNMCSYTIQIMVGAPIY